jgi:exportin-1
LVLKTNNRVAGSLGAGYIVQLARIYVDMLQVYKMYSSFVSLRIQEGGVIQTKIALIKSMRSVKKETLNLIRTFISQSQEMDREVILNNFIPALLDPVLSDYQSGVPDARDSEVLLLLSEIIAKLGTALIERGYVQRIFESVFQVTLDMITKNFEDYPDHRLVCIHQYHMCIWNRAIQFIPHAHRITLFFPMLYMFVIAFFPFVGTNQSSCIPRYAPFDCPTIPIGDG